MNEVLLKKTEFRIQNSEFRIQNGCRIIIDLLPWNANGIPRIKQAVGVEVGDLLEAKVEAGKITFTPKSVVDRSVAESLADFAAGRSFGPFNTDKELIKSLHQERPA